MKKHISFVLALALALCLVVPAAADSVCIGDYSYAISSGSTSWNGKSNGYLFGTYEGDATWYVSNTKTSPSVNATLYMVRTLLPDSQVASIAALSNGQSSKAFVASGSNGYYAVITAANSNGTTGRTWVNQDSSIVNLG